TSLSLVYRPCVSISVPGRENHHTHNPLGIKEGKRALFTSRVPRAGKAAGSRRTHRRVRRERGSMRASISSAVAAAGLVALEFRSCDGLSVGTDHACVLLDDASVKCFGMNDYGQLGQGDTDARGQSADTMGDNLEPVDLGTGAVVIAMDAGSDHTCVILDTGDVKCFGKNDKGQLGLGDTANRGESASEMGNDLPAVDLGAGRTAVAVSAEGEYTCVILDNGQVRCWGDGEFGSLGNGSEENTGDGSGVVSDSVNLGGSDLVTAIGEGPCAIFESGDMKCWGKGYYGKNGQGTPDNLGDGPDEMGDALPTVPLGTGRLPHSVSGGRDYNCVVLQDGGVKCWGRADGGQLGTENIATLGDDPSEMGDDLPTVELGTGETAVEVSAGSQHTCAVLSTGGVKCWGRGFFGNLGLESFRAMGHFPNTMGDDLPYVNLGAGLSALTVKAGGERTCAVLDNGSLKCWGGNSGGQLGLGDVDPRGLAAGQMGDDLPAVNLGTGRTAVALARAGLPSVAPSVAPPGAPTSASTSAPTASSTAGDLRRSNSTPSPAGSSSSDSTTPSPTAAVEPAEGGGSSSD
ncbi:unnamed protein product, partial [Pylaiella littoralis]